MNTCINCRFAKWDRTKTGRLSPDGGGLCTWKAPEFAIPKAMYWVGWIGSPKPTGGHIDRHDPQRYADCPAWEEIQKATLADGAT